MRPWRCSPHDKFGAHIRGLRDQSSLSLSVSLCLSLCHMKTSKKPFANQEEGLHQKLGHAGTVILDFQHPVYGILLEQLELRLLQECTSVFHRSL